MLYLKNALTLTFTLIVLTLNASKIPIKFGKATMDEVSMTRYELDTSASAVVLVDYGYSYIDYGREQFQVNHKRTTRIKILTKDGYPYADHSFMLYKNGDREEGYSQLKGITYNLVNGQIVKTKLDKSSIFEEEVDENHTRIRFTMPAVKEGSVVEFTYSKTSDFLFNYEGWQFQYQIPVVWSEYKALFIEYYTYRADFQGYLSPFINEEKTGTQNFNVRTTATIADGRSRESGSIQNYTANYTEKRIVLKDIPAFIVEPNITAPKDYLSMINFELEYSDFPGSLRKIYRGSWESLNKNLLENEYLGMRLRGASFLKKIVDEQTINAKNDSEKIGQLFNHFKNTIAWNGEYTKYAISPFKTVYEEAKGSSAEINLMLTNALLKAGIKAEPVLLSTRKNGMVKEYNAISGQFNYVICKAKLGDKYVLLDATEKFLPIGVLPPRCLNGNGFVLSETNSGWVPLSSKTGKEKKITGTIKIANDGTLRGELIQELAGYSGLKKRKKYFTLSDDEFKNNLINHTDMNITKVSLDNVQDIGKAFKETLTLEDRSSAEVLGDRIYFNPVLLNRRTDNIYKIDERTYPVNYESKINERYYVNFEIPEGYEIEEIPKPLFKSLPNKDAKFEYNAVIMNEKIVVFVSFNVKKTLYLPEEYAALKKLYSIMIDKLNEQVVLKKSA